MSSIVKFDPEAFKAEYFVGPFPTRKALIDACQVVARPNEAWEKFRKTTGKLEFDGHIITTADNDDLIARRFKTLKDQLEGRERIPALSEFLRSQFQKVADERAAKEKAANDKATDPLKVLLISTQRHNLFFALNNEMPGLKAQVTRFIADRGIAEKFNDLVSDSAPNLVDRVVHTADFAGEKFDVAVIDQALMYSDEESVLLMFKEIADTGAKKILIHSIHGVEAGWYGQRYSGGIIPFRVPTLAEIANSLKAAGYDIEVAELNANPSTDPIYFNQVPAMWDFAASGP